jgi:hypothetical protein
MCLVIYHQYAGSDPPGIKLRAAKALEAVDYFVPGYWVFSKLVQSLADIGYDNNNLVSCCWLMHHHNRVTTGSGSSSGRGSVVIGIVDAVRP